MAETGDCTKGWGKTQNNCHGIKKWRNGKLQPARYASRQDSYNDFIDTWQRLYRTERPTLAQARQYTGNDNAETWLYNVNFYLDA